MEERKSRRNGSIDFWKFVFSLMIVQFHSYRMTEIETIPFRGGAIGVEFFFLVSGYLMATSLSHYRQEEILVGRDSRKFLLHKIKSLCPEFFIAWGIAFFVSHIGKENVTVISVIKDFMTGIWELFFLRESGLTGFVANPVGWYISAMLLAMLVLVPLFLKNRDVFINVLAPVIAIVTLGFLCKEYGDLSKPTAWTGFCYRGVLRALGELCIGVMLWSAVQKFQKIKLTGGVKCFWAHWVYAPTCL